MSRSFTRRCSASLSRSPAPFACERGEQEGHFLLSEYGRQPFRSAGSDDGTNPFERRVEYGVVEEEQRGERLILRGCGHVAIDSQTREEVVHSSFAQRRGMLLAVKQDVSADPRDVGSLGAASQMHGPGRRANTIEKPGAAWLAACRGSGRRRMQAASRSRVGRCGIMG